MISLYLETNFLIQYAKNQDKEAQILIEESRSLQSLRIFTPSICCMESLSVLEDEIERRNNFVKSLEQEINQLRRNVISEDAAQLGNSLQEVKLSSRKMTNDIEARLFDALKWVGSNAELLDLKQLVLNKSLNEILVSDPTDNLILHCILSHSRQNPDAPKIFLSNNNKDFGTKEIKDLLGNAGLKYLTKTKDFLDWFCANCDLNAEQFCQEYKQI